MQEELILFETAKLANDKGWKFPYTIEYLEEIKGTIKYFDSLPTQSLLQRWLREKYNIDIIIKPWSGNKVGEKMYAADIFIFGTITYIKLKREGTYEQALEAGLQKGLELIKL